MVYDFPGRRRPRPVGALIGMLLAALLAGGATYAYQRHQRARSEQALQTQIDSLRAQLAATPAPTTAPSASPAATAMPTSSPTVAACPSAGLSLSFGPSVGGGAAGTVYYDISLKNTGGQACSLQGFPVVRLLDSKGAVLGTAQSTGTAGTTVTLAPGGSAYAFVGAPQVGNFPSGSCSLPASNVSVTPPGETAALKAPSALSYCPGMTVGPISATKQ